MSIQNEAKLPLVQFLILDLHRSVLNIWFNRPEARNALNDQMMSELGQVLDSIKYDRTIRTIVLRGKGGFFVLEEISKVSNLGCRLQIPTR